MTVDNYSWAYLWLISHNLSHGVPLMSDNIVYFTILLSICYNPCIFHLPILPKIYQRAYKCCHLEKIRASWRSLARHKVLRYYARFGGVSSADRNAPNQGVRSNCIFQIGKNAHFYWQVISVQRGDSPKILQFLLSSAVVFLPRYIDTNNNAVGGDVANAHSCLECITPGPCVRWRRERELWSPDFFRMRM
jgi:hypothetical protein